MKLWEHAYPLLNSKQLTAEQTLLKKTYPQFRLVWTGAFLAFRGALRTNYGGLYHIEVRLPPRYPEQEPHLWVLDPKLPPGTAHRYEDGRICAHADPFQPYRTTVATMISVMAGWLFRFERRRNHGVSWDVALEIDGRPLKVAADGTLYLAEHS